MILSALIELAAIAAIVTSLVAVSFSLGRRRGWDEGYEEGGNDAMRATEQVMERPDDAIDAQRERAWLQ